MTELDFDYVVVGSGSAGSVVANRLSTDPHVRVALIEAGPSDRFFPANIKTRLPIGNVFLLPHAKYNWRFALAGGDGVGGRAIGFPRGKLLGGCSSINGGVYIRGQPEDYDGWAEAGNAGWGYQDVLPAFRKMENYAGGASDMHGGSGELDMGKPREFNSLARAFTQAAQQAGHRLNQDFAGATQLGFGQYDVNQRRGVRLSASRAFLHPALKRPNLRVFDQTLCTRIMLEGRRAVGVEAAQRDVSMRLGAQREVVLCGGAINSPHLLMLSGIGPVAHLRTHGIEVCQALPGVGNHLQDHPTVYLAMENPSGESHAVSLRALPRIVASPFRYAWSGTGMLASNIAEAGGFICTRASQGRPDIQFTFLVGLKTNARVMPTTHGYMVLVQLLRPGSAGTVRLASSSPHDKPVIAPNFFDDPADMKTLIAGLREARRIVAQPALAAMSGTETTPGLRAQTDAELDTLLRTIANTAYHPTGTCRMGPEGDVMAVVDSSLRVHGIGGLRVADASIMPNIVSGNTSAACMMIGQRAADFIAQDRVRLNDAA